MKKDKPFITSGNQVICSFNTSKKAHRKGMVAGCQFYYELSLTENYDEQDKYIGPFGWRKGELNLQERYCFNETFKEPTKDTSWYICAAPTQSFLQKWLREKHNIHV